MFTLYTDAAVKVSVEENNLHRILLSTASL